MKWSNKSFKSLQKLSQIIHDLTWYQLSGWMANIFVLFEIICLKTWTFPNIFEFSFWYLTWCRPFPLGTRFWWSVQYPRCNFFSWLFLNLVSPESILFTLYWPLNPLVFYYPFLSCFRNLHKCKVLEKNKNKSVLLFYNSIAIIIIDITVSSPLSLLVLHFNWRVNDPISLSYC